MPEGPRGVQRPLASSDIKIVLVPPENQENIVRLPDEKMVEEKIEERLSNTFNTEVEADEIFSTEYDSFVTEVIFPSRLSLVIFNDAMKFLLRNFSVDEERSRIETT